MSTSGDAPPGSEPNISTAEAAKKTSLSPWDEQRIRKSSIEVTPMQQLLKCQSDHSAGLCTVCSQCIHRVFSVFSVWSSSSILTELFTHCVALPKCRLFSFDFSWQRIKKAPTPVIESAPSSPPSSLQTCLLPPPHESLS